MPNFESDLYFRAFGFFHLSKYLIEPSKIKIKKFNADSHQYWSPLLPFEPGRNFCDTFRADLYDYEHGTQIL